VAWRRAPLEGLERRRRVVVEEPAKDGAFSVGRRNGCMLRARLFKWERGCPHAAMVHKTRKRLILQQGKQSGGVDDLGDVYSWLPKGGVTLV
jgi:hypothetical protein